MAANPSVSVIIPVFQAERFIEIAVQSALMQEEVGEVILIEDGSTDCSLDICERLASTNRQKIKLFRHAKGANKGAGASRNLGICRASMPYIAFLDADDFYLEKRFSNDLRVLENNVQIDGIYNAMGYTLYDKDESARIKKKLTTVTYHIPPQKLLEEMAPIGRSGYFSINTVTVRKNVFDKVGLFESRLALSQDTHMLMKMASKLSLVSGIIDRPIAMRGVHKENRSKNSNQIENNRPQLYKYLLAWAKQVNLPYNQRTVIWRAAFRSYRNLVHNRNDHIVLKHFRVIFFLIGYFIKDSQLLIRSYNKS